MVGMTARESEMVTRFEAGEAVGDIAAAMGLAKETVRHVTSFLCAGLGVDGRFRQQMQDGSKELLARILEARGDLR